MKLVKKESNPAEYQNENEYGPNIGNFKFIVITHDDPNDGLQLFYNLKVE